MNANFQYFNNVKIGIKCTYFSWRDSGLLMVLRKQ